MKRRVITHRDNLHMYPEQERQLFTLINQTIERMRDIKYRLRNGESHEDIRRRLFAATKWTQIEE